MAKGKSQKKQSKQQGGDGAADHAIEVYGDTNSQHAVSSNNNTIAMNDGTITSMKGGKGKNEEEIVGGSNGDVVEEPSLLERLNPFASTIETTSGGKQSKQQLQKQIMKQLKQLKQQGGSPLSFSEFSSSPQLAQEASAKVTVNASGNQSGGSDGKQLDLQKGFLKAGSKLSKQQLQSLNQQLDKLQKQQQQGGVGLNEIVVPLILLYASQKYAEGKTTKKNMKNVRKSLRKSMRFSK